MMFPRLRPRLEMTVAVPPAEFLDRVRERLTDPGARCTGMTTDEQIELRPPDDERHFWSPQLIVRVREHPGGSLLTGRFGPDAPVWTLFLAAYAFVVLSAVFASFYGVAQLMIGEAAHALWAIPVAAVLVALIYVAAGIGQRLGHDQVDALQAFLDESCYDAPAA